MYPTIRLNRYNGNLKPPILWMVKSREFLSNLHIMEIVDLAGDGGWPPTALVWLSHVPFTILFSQGSYYPAA